jgi:hypothetical protein
MELTFVDSVLLITAFNGMRYAVKFSCKSTPKFTAWPGWHRTSPIGMRMPGQLARVGFVSWLPAGRPCVGLALREGRAPRIFIVWLCN